MSAKAQLSSNPDKFLGNITTGGNVDYGSESFYTLWNQITCENESKWASVEGTNNSFNWSGADRAFKYAKEHGFPFKFHALVWGSQYPKWLESKTPEQRYNEIVQWMDRAQAHFPDLKLIDVVNEAVSGHQAGTKYFEEALGGAGETGYDWIIKAFELAYERWPNAILIYNDFNTFQWNTDQFIDLVKTLRDAGAPIDAYGCQSHDLTDCSESNFKNAMVKLQNALKMPMYSTEYDIGTDDDDLQLQRYKEQIPYMWESDYCAGVTLWGYIYGRTWTTNGNSGIIKNGVDRPAMTWLREYMQTDAAKNAKSPFPGMYKEASVYIKPSALKVKKDDEMQITVRASMCTKEIEKVELYVKDELVATMTEAPYVANYTPCVSGEHEMKAVVTCTDGSTYDRISCFRAYGYRAPFLGTPAELPGIIEAENFDKGEEGLTFHDSDAVDEGNAGYRKDNEGVDIMQISDGEYCIGYTAADEWYDYSVYVTESGKYSWEALVSSAESGASFKVGVLEGSDFTYFRGGSVPTTGEGVFTTVTSKSTKHLVKGQHIIRVYVNSGNLDLDKIEFKLVEADAIEEISADETSAGQAYNIVGQRVGENYKGIQVKDGKKILKR